MNQHMHMDMGTHGDDAGASDADHTHDPQMIHHFVVIGADTMYLSHLSMFSMAEHRIQLIVEVEFAELDGSPTTAYQDDRKAHPGQKLYTLDPGKFVLSDILPEGSHPPRLSTLKANLFRNHLEQGDTNPEVIASGEVRIKRVVHARWYEPDPQPLSNLEYLLFGKGTETYLAHFITRPPDFDQLLRVNVDHDLSDEELAHGVRLTVTDRANALEDKLEEGGAAVPAVVHGASGDGNVTVEAVTELYCNHDADMQ
jgi:hypothetical protein